MKVISFLENHMFACQWKENFHFECLGCGAQRSFIYLLRGDIIAAFHMYPAIYTLILLLGYSLLHLKFKFIQGTRIILSLFVINVLIILTNYIIKFI